MSNWVATVGSQPTAVQAAQEFLDTGGSAVGAVVSGFFADAGVHAGVLLGPLVIIVAGIGAGVRVFDGRLRQPGLGAKRPRGFTSDVEIPLGAHLAVPHAVSAAVVAHTYDRTGSFGELVKPGIRYARQQGAELRAGVLEGIQAHGGRYLSSSQVARPLLYIAGASEGGLLTHADLVSVPNLDSAASCHVELGEWSVVPWASGLPDTECPLESIRDDSVGPIANAMVQLLLAVDSKGTFAGACYQHSQDGVPVEELQLTAPIAAVPVRRGIPRLAPGTCLPSPAPMAVRVWQNVAVSIVGDASRCNLTAQALLTPPLSIHRHPATRRVATNGQMSELREFPKNARD